jgi:V8-like Glu-specific endopeptidase
MAHGNVIAVNSGHKDDPSNYTLAISDNSGEIFCSGALIHPRIVLTAAMLSQTSTTGIATQSRGKVRF